MPLRETEAIVLRTYRLGEADKIASLFTRQFGCLRAVAGGAQRPKSRYGGTLEGLTYLRVWLFERENRDLLRLNSAELIESFFEMQKDYHLQVAAQYVAEVTQRLLPERELNERAFRLVLTVLRGLKRSGEVNRPLLYFNYWILRLGGFLPDLENCLACGQRLGDDPGYDDVAGGLRCARCRSGYSDHRVAGEALSVAALLRQVSLDRWLAEPAPPAGCTAARVFLEQLVEFRAEKKLITRELLGAEW